MVSVTVVVILAPSLLLSSCNVSYSSFQEPMFAGASLVGGGLHLFCSWNLGRHDISHHGTMRQTIDGIEHRKLLKPNKQIIVIPIISL